MENEKTYGITDIGTWWNDEANDKIFRYQVYKRTYTPYEQDQKFSDETIFEDDYHFAFISNLMEIPNDILIEFEEGYFDTDNIFQLNGNKAYRRLSEIYLVQCKYDNIDIKISED